VDICWTAPTLAKQVPLYVAYSRSTAAGAAVDADEQLAGHLLESSKIAAQTAGQKQTKDGHSRVITWLKMRFGQLSRCPLRKVLLSRDPRCHNSNRLWIDRYHVGAIPGVEFAEPVSDPNEFGGIS
jgi:hypothetical protein